MCLTRFPSVDMEDEPALNVEVISKEKKCRKRLFEDDDAVNGSPLKRKKNRSE